MASRTKAWVKGYSLIELIIVIVLIGILSATAAVGINGRSQYGVRTDANEFRRDLSRIQLMAISQSQRIRLSTALNGSSYTVTGCTSTTDCTTALTDPLTGASPFTVNFKNAIFSAIPATHIEFDTLGRPQSDGTLLDAADLDYTLAGSGLAVTVRVTRTTGFAWVTN